MDLYPGKANSSLLSYMSFDSGNNEVIKNTFGKKNLNNNDLITGTILPNINNFWAVSGTACFNNNYIKIQNNNNLIDFSNFTFVSVIENTGSFSGATLFSTVQTGFRISYDDFGVGYEEIYSKGWELGLTSNNKLYFEYKDNNGIQNFITRETLPDKSPIFLQISSKNLNFGYYDYFSNTLKNNSYRIKNEFIFDPDSLYIGYNPVSSGLYNFNKAFLGKMDHLLLFSPSIYNYELENIFSGFVSTYIPESYFLNEYEVSGVIGFTTGVNGERIPLYGKIIDITGYTTGIVNVRTELTGIETIFTGIYEDDFGNILEGFDHIFLSGSIQQTGLIPLSGFLIRRESGINPASLIIDVNEISQYGKSVINLLSKIDKDDFIDIEFFTGDNFNLKYKKNLRSLFDRVNDSFVFNDIKFDNENKNYVVYVNGQLLNSGNKQQIGGIYSPISFITNKDFIELSRGEIIFNNNFNILDNVFGDIISGEAVSINNFIEFNNNLDYVINHPNLEFNKYNIFINGQKLCSGKHYTITNNIVYFNTNDRIFSDVSGLVSLVTINRNYHLTGSNQNLFISSRPYYENYSQIYKNGLRQQNAGDYIETSKLNILNGRAIFDNKLNLVYNNNTLF